MSQARKPPLGFVLWVIVVTLLFAWARADWPQGNWLATDFQALLPHEGVDPWVERANVASAASFDRQLLWLVEGQDQLAVNDFFERVKARLEGSGFARADFEVEQMDRWQGISQALYPFRWGLLSPQDRGELAAQPRVYLESFQRLLYSPLGAQYLGALDTDPTGHYSRFLSSVAPSFDVAGSPAVQDGVYSRLGVSSVPPEKLGFDTLDGLYLLYRELGEEAAQKNVSLSLTGVPLYSAYGVHSAKREMSTIGAASLLLLVVLLVWALRSMIAVALTLLCVSAGVLGGLAVTVVVLQQIHILTLVFGATLIGIAADYALHYFSHSLLPQWSQATALRSVFKGLLVGMITSVLAFSALVFLPFPGIRQIGLFMASGLLCSFLTVCLVFPLVFRRRSSKRSLPAFCNVGQWAWSGSPRLPLALFLLAVAGLSLLVGKDDVRSFYAAPAALKEAEASIQRYSRVKPDSRYLLVQAAGRHELLEAEQIVIDQLHLLQKQGQLTDFSGITKMIPAESVQWENLALWRRIDEQGLLAAYFERLGFSKELVEDTRSALLAEFSPANLEVLEEVDLPLGLAGFLGCDEHGCASWLRLGGVSAAAPLEALARDNASLRLIEPIAHINRSIERYRSEVGKMLVLALLLALVLLGAVCGWRQAVQIIFLPLMACVSSLLLLGLVTGSFSIVNLMALLLVFGVGLDYSIFRAFTPVPEQGATTLAIALSAMTSILAFGMLAFSSTPVISSFGQTIAIGLFIAYSLSWIRFERREVS